MRTLMLAQARAVIDGALPAAGQQRFRPMGVGAVHIAAQVVASVRARRPPAPSSVRRAFRVAPAMRTN